MVESSFTATAERTIAYARATNDPLAAHLDGELAPPVFAVVPAWEAFMTALVGVVPAELLPLFLHGEQDIRIHRPIVPGETLHSSADVIGMHPKGTGTTVVIRSRTTAETGEPVNEQHLVAFVRTMRGSPDGVAAPDHTFAEELRDVSPTAEVTAAIDADQTYRYAQASGDHNPIHVDEDTALAAGMPGIIVHGLCTMAFTSWALIQRAAGGDPRKLRRLAVRFSQPLRPGDEITTRVWPVRPGIYQYETTTQSGAVVIRNGLAEIG